jgi:hypothetical protein
MQKPRKKLTKKERFLKELAVFSVAVGNVPVDFCEDEDFDESGKLQELIDKCQEFSGDASELIEEIIKANKLKPRKGQFWMLP